jgi:hypothetical protein
VSAIKRSITDNVRKYDHNFEALSETIQILPSGLDYRKYIRITTFLPYVYKRMAGDYHVARIYNLDFISKEDIQFAIDFVLESALKVQDFRSLGTVIHLICKVLNSCSTLEKFHFLHSLKYHKYN